MLNIVLVLSPIIVSIMGLALAKWAYNIGVKLTRLEYEKAALNAILEDKDENTKILEDVASVPSGELVGELQSLQAPNTDKQ
jgi:hypothetical protein